MQSLASLPPELLDRVFYFLQEKRSDVSSCRLVCKIFKECSSPYLITRVVFAKRLRDIERLQDVLNHPYFSKYVTEFIYDASHYDDRLAHDWIGYVNACERAPRYLHDVEWTERKSRDDAMIDTLCARSPGADVEQTDLSFRRFDGGGGMDRYYDHVYGLGCHRTLPDYNRLEKAQDRIWAAQLSKAMLEEAMSKLPSLKSVILTDWRSLARTGESYDETAFRLFRNTLAPRLSDRGGLELLSELDMLLKAVAYNPQIESFSTGSPLHGSYSTIEHRYVTGTRGTRALDAAQSLPSISLMVLQQVLSPETLDFSHLQRLDLYINSDDSSSGIFALPQAEQIGLRTALLSMTNLASFSLGLARVVPNPDGPYRVLAGEEILKGLLSGLHLPNLHRLRLEGWLIAGTFLQGILELHASSIRSVKIVDCNVYGDTKQLAEWVAANLTLQGVSLKSLAVSWEEHRTDLSDDEHLWLAGRTNHVVLDSIIKVVGYSDDGKKYDNDERRPWWAQKLVWA